MDFWNVSGIFFLLFGFQNQVAAAPLTIHYSVRPPYVEKKDSTIQGLTASPTIAALKEAHIEYRLSETPINRQLVLVKNNQGLDCGVGWFKTKERLEFGKFSEILYQDSSWVAIANKYFHPQEKRLDQLFKNPRYRLLVRDQYLYGDYISGLIKSLNPNRVSITGETSQMLHMVRSRRADYFFVTEEEVRALLRASGFSEADFSLYKFVDVPRGEARHLICSKRVPDSVISRFNAALARGHRSHIK